MADVSVIRNYKDTVNPNMPLRDLIYVTKVLRLSDAYEKPLDTPELELIVSIYNINIGNNPELLEACQLLKEYAQYVDLVSKLFLQLGYLSKGR